MLIMDNIPLLIHRISLGKLIFQYDNVWYVLYSPTCSIKYEAELLYNELVEEHMFDDWLRKETIGLFLSRVGIWKQEDNKIIEKVEKNIENYKLSLYLNRLSSDRLKYIRKDLQNAKEELHKLLSRKYSLDYLTLEDFATNKKNEYILTNSLYYKDSNTKVFDTDLDTVDYNSLERIVSTISKYTIPIETYKNIARHETWKMIWNANKSNIFDRCAIDFTDEQKTLVGVSQMYDKIYEHPECPPENVINDDDMLDGWMIEQKRKNDTLKKEGASQDLATKHNKAKEIFVVGDKEDVSEINSLNSLESKHIIRQRSRTIKSSETGVDEINLPDVKQELLQKINTNRK